MRRSGWEVPYSAFLRRISYLGRPHMTDQASAKPKKSITSNTVGGFVHLTSSTLATALLRLFVVGVMARLLAPGDFGVVAVSNIFVEFARMIATSGVSQSIVQVPHITENHIKTAFTSSMIIGLIVMAIVIVTSPFIAQFFDLPNLKVVLYVSSVIPPVLAFSTISSKLLEREHNFKPIAKIGFISYIAAQVAIGIPIAYFGGGYWALIIPQIASALVQSLMLLRAQPHNLSFYLGRDEYRELMRLGTGFGLQGIANFIALRGDYFVVGKVLGPINLGKYERSYVLMNLSNALLASMLNTVLFPAFARVSGDHARFRRAYLRCMQITATVTIPISVACVALAPEIVETLLGSRWLDATTPFSILAGGIFARTCYKVAGSAGNGLGLAYENAVSQTLYAICVVGGAAIGSMWGINGVAVSTLTSIGIVFLLLNNTVIRRVGLTWADMGKAVLPGVASAVVIGLTALFVVDVLRAHMPLPAVFRLTGSLSLAGIAYLAFTAIAPTVFLGRGVIELLDEKLPRTGHVARVRRFVRC